MMKMNQIMKIKIQHWQRGIALLILMLIVLLMATSLLLARLNKGDNQLIRQAQTVKALAQAKAALIGFAATYADDPDHKGQPQGYLPCPDFNGDGSSPYSMSSDTSCGEQGKSMIGRLPWRTLGLPPLRDGHGECLWYAVSGSYKDRPKQALTSDEDGLLIVKDANGSIIAGTTATDRAIAIVFSAGAALTAQNRGHTGVITECGADTMTDDANNPLNYLDNLAGIANNATGSGLLNYKIAASSSIFTTTDATDIPIFVSAPETKDANNQVIFNDVLSIITPKDFEPVYRRMNEWVAERVTQCVVNYASKNISNFLSSHQAIIGDWATPVAGTYRATYAVEVQEYVTHSISNCKLAKCNTESGCKQVCKETEDECISECTDSACEQTCQGEKTSCNLECANSVTSCELACDNKANSYRKSAIEVNSTYPWATTRVDSASLEDYADENNVRFGRVPLTLAQTLGTNQHMQTIWGTLSDKTCTTNKICLDNKICFDESAGLGNYEWGWWEKWKEMVFYAVDDNYTPNIGTYFNVKHQLGAKQVAGKWERDNTSSYTRSDVLAKIDATAPNGWVKTTAIVPFPESKLKLSGADANFVILVAGRKLSSQPNRDDKLKLDDYLETQNSTPADDEFERKSLTPLFNDVACRNTRADCKKIPQGNNQ